MELIIIRNMKKHFVNLFVENRKLPNGHELGLNCAK